MGHGLVSRASFQGSSLEGGGSLPWSWLETPPDEEWGGMRTGPSAAARLFEFMPSYHPKGAASGQAGATPSGDFARGSQPTCVTSHRFRDPDF